MISIRYMSLTQEENEDNIVTTLTYQGTDGEISELQREIRVGQDYYVNDTDGGRVKRLYRHQIEGDLWGLEVRCETNCHGSSVTPPSADYGKKTATLDGGLISLPLERHPDYRTCWKYYLASCQGTNITPEVPAWHETATTTIVPDRNFRWVTSPSELPYGQDSEGKIWRIVAEPEMLGQVNYELSTYTVRETVKCRTQSQAGTFVMGKLNKIVNPVSDFGVTDGCNWKCDHVSVGWSGKYWLATLTYTRSGNSRGWNRKLYS